MRIITRAGIAGISVTAGLALAACGSSASSSSSSTVAPASPSTTAAAGTTAASTPAASTPAAPSATTGSASGAAAAAGTCQPASLRVALGAHSGTNQVTQAVDLTNTGSSPCTLKGFAGVNLFGSAQGKSDYQWPLTRASQSYSAVTLQPNAAAHFNLVYLPAKTGDTVIHVTKIVVTPPNDLSSVNVPFTQDILLQDAATHPGTWISPVQAGA